MPYLGNAPSAAFQSVAYQDLTGGTGTSFTLSHAVSSAQEIEVFVNNVRQEPTVAYTVAGTALTMTGTIAATDDFYVVFQGKAVGSVSHPTTSPLAATTGNFTGNVTSSGTITASSFSGDGSGLTGVSAGKVLNVEHASVTAGASFSLTAGTNTAPNYADTALTLNITPSATTSKILVLGSFYHNSSASNYPSTMRVIRDSTAISLQLGRVNYVGNLENTVWCASINALDEPSTTSQITYTAQIGNPSGTTVTTYFNSNYYNSGMFESFLTAIEIGV